MPSVEAAAVNELSPVCGHLIPGWLIPILGGEGGREEGEKKGGRKGGREGGRGKGGTWGVERRKMRERRSKRGK